MTPPVDGECRVAADIAERGLLHPVVLDVQGRVLDGRNRLAACERAGVEPSFVTFDGDDPDGYALAVNIARRHLTTGARAVIAAKAARLNGQSNRAAAAGADLRHERINDANEQMRSGQASFDVGEHDLIVALAGKEEVEEEQPDGGVITLERYSHKETARCRIGVIGMDEYLRWDFLQDANRRAANEAYDKGKARFARYLPYFQQGLTIEEIDRRGLLG